MAVTLQRLRQEVRERVGIATRPWGEFEDDIVLATVLALGMYVADDGEVGSPVPPPVNVFTTQPRQSGVRYSGQPRRKKGYRR